MSAYTKDSNLHELKSESRVSDEPQINLPRTFYEYESVIKTIRSMEATILGEREKQSQFKSEIENLKTRIHVLSTEIERHKSEHQVTKIKETNLKEQINIQVEKLNNTRSELERNKAEKNQLQALMSIEQSKIREFTLQNNNIKIGYEQTISHWKEKYSWLMSELEESKGQLRTKEFNEQDLKKQINHLQSELDKIKARELKSYSEIHTNKTKLSEITEELRLSKNTVESLSMELNNARSSSKESNDKISKYQASEDKARKDLLETKEDLARLEKEMTFQKEQVHKSSKAYDILKIKVKNIVDEFTQVKLNNHLLQKELQNSKQKLKEEMQLNRIFGSEPHNQIDTSNLTSNYINDPESGVSESTVFDSKDEVHSLLQEQKRLLSDLLEEQ